MTEFFIPIEPNAEPDRLTFLVKSVLKHLRLPESTQCVLSVSYHWKGSHWSASVGEAHAINDEIVQLIFADEKRQQFVICTENRGFLRGEPIYAPNDFQSNYTSFE